ncbi:hypothetical protein IE077_002345 [Cardiosporidium cionae]|uniref:C2H2-type domain-containing protein n=1 Tax=Cardiosporidium cionae TaxID=476202 RepID=A0ABQ7JFQ7_9APIC|nr:hypothetical protein IE077_002345 [Cardiosporidium cionae]|eukprot:KAF8822857.1 hypothetical protein IE077_002345 [Cardiosporidium cionae]
MMKQYQGTSSTQWNCMEESCGKCFSKKSHFIRHLRVHTGERPFFCNTCGKSYSRQEHLTRHSFTHTGESPYICSHVNCGKAFIDSTHLKRHQFTHLKPHQCDQCGSCFQKLTQMIRHQMKHSFEADCSDSLKRYYCPYRECNGRYVSFSGLKRHMQCHDHPKLYVCSSCPDSFVKFLDLVSHRKRCHPLVHECSACSKVFTRSSQLLSHVKRQHGVKEEESSNASLLFLCSVANCGMTFETKQAMVEHIRVKHLEESSGVRDVSAISDRKFVLVTPQRSLYSDVENATVIEGTAENTHDCSAEENCINVKRAAAAVSSHSRAEKLDCLHAKTPPYYSELRASCGADTNIFSEGITPMFVDYIPVNDYAQ